MTTPEQNPETVTAENATPEQIDSQQPNPEQSNLEHSNPPQPKKKKILIGSQLGEDEHTKPKAVVGAELNPGQVSTAVQTDQPSSDPNLASELADQLTSPTPEKNVDEEIDELMADVSMDQLLEGQSIQEELELDSRVKATVEKIHNENVFLRLKGRFEGVASIKNFKTPPEAGAMLDVIVKSHNAQDGLYEVIVPGASMDVADWSDLTQGAVVEVKVTGSNTGGLECVINNIRGFIPASQIEIFRVENFGDYVNQKLQCVVQEVNESKRKLVLSHRAIAERERAEKKKELLETLEVGETRDGTVTKLMDFGAFVDIGGVEGLIHISKLSWERVGHPKEVVKEGESVSVKVEKIDKQTGKIGLSLRDTQEHPWKKVDEKYPVNTTVKGTVSKLAQFGAFVKLEPGIEGLVHISEIAHHRVVAVSTHLKTGDEVEVKIVSVDPQAQKIGLSIKALLAKPEKPEGGKNKKEEVDEPLREPAVKPSNEPLKGGTQKKTGGEDFGLNW